MEIELKKLKKVNDLFKAAKAEKETFLPNAFENTRYSDLSLSSQYPIIIGRKGAGKSAIVKVIAQRERDKYENIIVLTSKDFDYSTLLKSCDRAKQQDIFEERLHLKYTWQKVLLTSIMLQLVKKAEKTGVWTGDLEKIKKALTNIGIAEPPKFIEISNKALGVLENIVKVSPEKVDGLVKKVFFDIDMNTAIDSLKNHLRTVKSFVIFVDGLDKDIENYMANGTVIFSFIRTLIETVLELHEDEDFAEKLLIKAFVPTDIYNKIKADMRDIDTVRLDVEEIRWNHNKLYELVCKRLIVGLNIKRHGVYSTDYDTAWQRLFPKQVTTRPLAGERRAKNTFQYLLDHTLYRPRDLIILCHYIFQFAEDDATEEKAIINDTIINDAIDKFTRETPEIICLEYKYRLGDAYDLIMHFQGRGQIQFTVDEFKGLISEYAKKNNIKISIRKAMDKLYEMGFVGIVHVRDDTINPQIKYFDEYYSYERPSINISAANSIKIHHLFHNALLLHH